jgi:opine dehydrogenase
MAGEFQCGPDALKNRYITEDVPYSLVLASSIGDELGVDTSVIDSLITIVSTAADINYWAEGRTLATWGLKGAGREGLIKAVDQGWW